MKLHIESCRQARENMDFLSNTALDFDKSELEAHLRFCAACAREFSERARLKNLLKRAMRATPAASISLRAKIQNLIHSEA